jgi:hypothetical protein
MRGALKITYTDGSDDYFEVDPVGDDPGIVGNLKAFLASPHVTLILKDEVLIIPSTSIRQLSISRGGQALPEEELGAIPGVLVGVSRILG